MHVHTFSFLLDETLHSSVKDLLLIAKEQPFEEQVVVIQQK